MKFSDLKYFQRFPKPPKNLIQILNNCQIQSLPIPITNYSNLPQTRTRWFLPTPTIRKPIFHPISEVQQTFPGQEWHHRFGSRPTKPVNGSSSGRKSQRMAGLMKKTEVVSNPAFPDFPRPHYPFRPLHTNARRVVCDKPWGIALLRPVNSCKVSEFDRSCCLSDETDEGLPLTDLGVNRRTKKNSAAGFARSEPPDLLLAGLVGKHDHRNVKN